MQISRIRAPGERHFAVIKTVFKAAHVFVTTVGRIHVKMIFTDIAYNLCQSQNAPQSRRYLVADAIEMQSKKIGQSDGLR